MKDKLYKMMNWPEIEGIIYAEEAHPEKVLGCHPVTGGLLYQMFYPGAKEVSLVLNGDTSYPMEMADEEGFFAAFIPHKEQKKYYFMVTDQEQNHKKVYDPYSYPDISGDFSIQKWDHGIYYDAYTFLGAHMIKKDGVEGVRFAVWAPNAIRVSAVGDFNQWNGKSHQMIKDEESGIFMLFVPEISENSNYKYEIKIKGGKILLKADPYAFAMHQAPDTASVITREAKIKWSDREWIKKREKRDIYHAPLSIYECNLSKLVCNKTDDILDIADTLISYVRKMGYTHVEFMPVMESYQNAANGYCTSSFFALRRELGTQEDFMEFINRLHMENIGVILDWSPAAFADVEHGLTCFDGTYLYGHLDERQRRNVAYDALDFNYGRPQVTNFLISNVMYWISSFHVDGIRFAGLSSILYLDYGKREGEWVANLYGGNENLYAIEFIKHTNSILHQKYKGLVTIAKETSAWPGITESLDQEGLGFDYTWNTGFIQDYLTFISQDADRRLNRLSDLMLSMVYAYSENYILAFSHDDVKKSEDSLCAAMSGEKEEQEAQLRATLTYQMCHPGKKMLYMGPVAGNHQESLTAEQLETVYSSGISSLITKLNLLYQQLPALSVKDNDVKGFEWIHNINYMDGVICFVRKGDYLEDTLLVICNFSKKAYSSYKLGVPYEGKYKEILNSQQKEYGGEITLSSRYKVTKEEEYDGRINSLTLFLAPLSVAIYSFKPYTQEELLDIAEKKAQKIRERLEKEALMKANAFRKLSLRETLEQKINEADTIISNGKEVEKEIKVIKKSRR